MNRFRALVICGVVLFGLNASAAGNEFKCDVQVYGLNKQLPLAAGMVTSKFGGHDHYLNVYDPKLRYHLVFSQNALGTKMLLEYLDATTGQEIHSGLFDVPNTDLNEVSIGVSTNDGYDRPNNYLRMGFHCVR